MTACVYVADVQQGNVIDKEELDQLKVGMTKKQVKFLLGSPIIIDTFHKNRWDYVYTFRKGDNYILENRRMILLFKGNKLAKIDNQGYPNPPLETQYEED